MARRSLTLPAASVAALIAIAVVGASADDRPHEIRADPQSVYDPIIGGEDFPGGLQWPISRDGIPPIYEPTFVTGTGTGWATEDLVIGVVVGTEAKAYPVGLLAAREIVNDWIDGTPVLVTWCPLCGTAIAVDRTVDGEPTLFGNQGALWGNAMTWWDHRTGSIWSQPIARAIAGPLEGRRLEIITSTLTTWGVWRGAHPETLALEGPTYPAGTALDELAIVVELGGSTTAYAIPLLLDAGVVNDQVGDVPVAVVAPAPDREWVVFSRAAAGHVLTLEYDDHVLVDVETATTWDPITGESTGGLLAGERLLRLPASTVFPKDFATFWPDGDLWRP